MDADALALTGGLTLIWLLLLLCGLLARSWERDCWRRAVRRRWERGDWDGGLQILRRHGYDWMNGDSIKRTSEAFAATARSIARAEVAMRRLAEEAERHCRENGGSRSW